MGSASQHGFLAFFAATVYLSVAGFFSTLSPFSLPRVFFLLLGSIFPDVDSVTSKIHGWLLWPRLLGNRWKHWGHAHSILGDFLFSLPLLFLDVASFNLLGISTLFSVFFNAGCFLHCLLDEIMKGKGNRRKALKPW